MGIPTLIGSAHTASNAASIEITSGIDGTYDEYMFVMTDMFPHTNGENMRVTFSTDGGTGYGLTKTSAFFHAQHYESGSGGSVSYDSSYDSAQSTAAQNLTYSTGGDADQSYSGIMRLWQPSSTTFQKHFYARTIAYQSSDRATDTFIVGYVNTTSAVDAIQFAMHDGNFDSVIQMYGIE